MSPEAAIATFSEPEAGLVPLHAPEALHVDAFVVVQVKVVSAPIATLMGLAVRLTVAGGVGGGVGSEEPPPPPPQAVRIIIDRKTIIFFKGLCIGLSYRIFICYSSVTYNTSRKSEKSQTPEPPTASGNVTGATGIV